MLTILFHFLWISPLACVRDATGRLKTRSSSKWNKCTLLHGRRLVVQIGEIHTKPSGQRGPMQDILNLSQSMSTPRPKGQTKNLPTTKQSMIPRPQPQHQPRTNMRAYSINWLDGCLLPIESKTHNVEMAEYIMSFIQYNGSATIKPDVDISQPCGTM